MEMVPQVDVLMSAALLTKETRQMFNESVFRKMKPLRISSTSRVAGWLIKRRW